MKARMPNSQYNNAAEYFELHHMQVTKEMNSMFSTKKISMILKYIVGRISIAALVVIVGMAGSAAASSKPRPIVTSTNPADDAVNVPVNTSITVNFSEPMDCNTISISHFRLKDVRHGRIAAERISCGGTSATLTPLSDLAVNTRYEVVLHGTIKAANGTPLWDNGWGWDFTTAPSAEPPATATPTATATGTATPTATSTATATATSTATATATSTSTATATATDTATATATDTATATATATDTPTATATDTSTATTTATATSTATATVTATSSATSTATATPTATATAIAPTVFASAPAIVGCGGQGMGTNQAVTVTFSEPMNPASINGTTFTVMGPGVTPVLGGIVVYDATNNIALFYPPKLGFAANTTFTATITTGAESAGLLPLANNYVFTFTTGAGPDTTPPLVSSTDPADLATLVATNQKIVVTFDKGMDSTTITPTTFTLMGPGVTPVLGAVTYSTIGDTATFTPSSALATGVTYTATITTGVQDLSGNNLASNSVWTFTTGLATDTTAPTVTSTNPADLAGSVGVDASVNATFDKAMDSSTLNPDTFTLTGPGATMVVGKVSYDVSDQIATFTPTSPLATNTTFTATIAGALDLAGNALATTSWTFSTGSATTGQSPLDLGSASSYAILANTAVTSPTAIVVNGDLGVSPAGAVTGFPPSTVNGAININNSASAAAQADLLIAYNDLFALPAGATKTGNLGGTTLPPGIYTAPATSMAVSSGNLTLDAQGDPNAVWIFQVGSTLDVVTQVILANGAQASNVFWGVGSSATIEVNAVMQGNILALTSVTVNSGATLNGRALALNAAVTAGGSSASLPGCQ
jgi:Ice-binding-like/Bacterial Ig-like domain